MRELWLCVILCSSLGLVFAADPAKICGLDGFDLSYLNRANYWEFEVPNPKINCYHDISDDEVQSCSVFFSACSTLPQSVCSAAATANVSVCQVLTATNGSTYSFDIGKYRTDDVFFARTTGFSTIRNGEVYPNEKACNSSFLQTVVNFECEPNAKYDSSDANITKYLSSVVRVISSPCTTAYNLNYSGACYEQPTIAPAHCSLSGYDTDTISEREYWIAKVPTSICFGFNDSCLVVFAFCHPLPLDLSEHCRHPESAVCQTDKLVEATNSWSMGAFENYTRFYDNVDTDHKGFHVQYRDGSNPEDPDCPSGLMTRVIFVCNKMAVWKNENLTEYIEIEKDEGCNFNIMLQYSGACVYNPVSHKSHDQQSYIGWIFIGIFFFAIVMYLGVGCTYQLLVRKEQGLRIIPNFDFWRTFVILVLEGCKFSLDVITCHRFDGVPRSSRPKMDYDQI